MNGIWVLINNEERKFWLGSSLDVKDAMVRNLRIIDTYLDPKKKTLASFYKFIPHEVQESVVKNNKQIADEVLVLLMPENNSILLDNKIKNIGKSFLFKHFKNLGYEYYIDNNFIQELKEDYSGENKILLDSMLKEEEIKLKYASNIIYDRSKITFSWDNESNTMKESIINFINESSSIKVTTKENKEKIKGITIKIDDDTEKLLKIQSLLDGKDIMIEEAIEDFIQSFISDKAKEIYKVMN